MVIGATTTDASETIDRIRAARIPVRRTFPGGACFSDAVGRRAIDVLFD
jgi:hypothetical protein